MTRFNPLLLFVDLGFATGAGIHPEMSNGSETIHSKQVLPNNYDFCDLRLRFKLMCTQSEPFTLLLVFFNQLVTSQQPGLVAIMSPVSS